MDNNKPITRKWMISEEELDDEQYKIRALPDDDYLIEGCAGSGKTVLALQKAKEIQDSEKGSYLVVVYTKALKSFIKDGVTTLGLNPSKVCHYHNLETSGFQSADYIIVDEIQDFSYPQIEKLAKMANKNFIFFGDDAQQLYSINSGNMTLDKIKNILDMKATHHKKLEKNYRLPLKIAEFAKFISSTPNNIVDRCNKKSGDKPMITKYNNQNLELDDIIDIIKTQTWMDVGILVANNDDVIRIKDYFIRNHIEVEYKYDEKNEEMNNKETFNTLNFQTSHPKIMTYHSSKGLQFQQVFLPACEINSTSFNYKDALYVAVTRATDNLFISFTNNLSPFIACIPKICYDFKIK